jgi:hypothetical protein
MRVVGFMDFETLHFVVIMIPDDGQRLDRFSSAGEGRETPTLLGSCWSS